MPQVMPSACNARLLERNSSDKLNWYLYCKLQLANKYLLYSGMPTSISVAEKVKGRKKVKKHNEKGSSRTERMKTITQGTRKISVLKHLEPNKIR